MSLVSSTGREHTDVAGQDYSSLYKSRFSNCYISDYIERQTEAPLLPNASYEPSYSAVSG